MKKTNRYLVLWMTAAVAVFIAMLLMTVTFAWFSANRKVSTEVVTARTGAMNLELQISRPEGDFDAKTETDWDGTYYERGTVYAYASLKDRDHVLMPVSTEDLKTFIYNPQMEDDVATTGTLVPLRPDVEEEAQRAQSLIYHDTLLLRLKPTESIPEDTKADLYLDNLRNAPIAWAPEGSTLLDAARLGLVIGGKTSIIRFSEDAPDAVTDTRVGQELLRPGQVLGYEEERGIVVKENPSMLLSQYQYSDTNPNPVPLLTGMQLDTVYQLDIYFYLEGCDPDCRNAQNQTADLALALFATPA